MSTAVNRTFPKDIVELALQIVGDYPKWCEEHCEEMCNISETNVDFDELCSACYAVDLHVHKEGFDHAAVVAAFTSPVETASCEISVNSIHSAIRVGKKAGLSVTRKCNNGGVTWICEVSGNADLVAKFVRRFEY